MHCSDKFVHLVIIRAPDKVHILISRMLISSSNPRFYHLLKSSHRDDSNKWSKIEFGKEIIQVDLIEVNLYALIWIPGLWSYEMSYITDK